MNADPLNDTVAASMAALTLEEAAALSGGADMWHGVRVERLEIGPLTVTDGPIGARGSRYTGSRSACFPCGTALAASWDVDLIRRVGMALGAEAADKGAHVLLAPTVNLHRTPLAGRNFECFSEDPYLTSAMAVAYIEGVQSRGVGCCVKHFVANDQEHERHTISAEVPERALRELYLAPFEAAVAAGVWSVMGAYNKVAGTWCCEHPQLLTKILRDEWGFDGLVISDWFATHSTAEAATAGLDLEMPGRPQHLGRHLLDAVEAGAVAASTVTTIAGRHLRLLARTGALPTAPPAEERHDDVPERRAVVREAAAAGVVLLTNDGVLPLKVAGLRRVALIGPNAARLELQGGGSAQVNPHPAPTLTAALKAALGPAVEVVAEPGCTRGEAVPAIDPALLAGGGLDVAYVPGSDPGGPIAHTELLDRTRMVWMGAPAPGVPPGPYTVRATGRFRPDVSGPWLLSMAATGPAFVAVDGMRVLEQGEFERGPTFFNLGGAELSAVVELEAGREYALAAELDARDGAFLSGLFLGARPPLPAGGIERAVALAAGCDAALVVVGADSEWETEGRDRTSLDLPGEQAALVAAVCEANPATVVVVNAGAPVALACAERAAALLQVWYPGQDGAEALVDLLIGSVNPSGRLPVTIPERLEDTATGQHARRYPGLDGHVYYEEGLFLGYRHHDRHGIEPKFCFGHGLSYTTFEHADLRVQPDGDALEVRVAVTNLGALPGAEVVQLYISPLDAGPDEPIQQLRGFAKVWLAPGQCEDAVIRLRPRDFARWDESAGGWARSASVFEVAVGASSRDIRLRAPVSPPAMP